ncbi:YebO family protein [Pantoea rwandensis]|uniref:Uncharacterized protein n=1 Tax=Pantoea rwandensis TaxID=1076550 RepID=A0A1X1CP77_9GAMM|nr:YebO family protein [Pantoea rwandensis]ORM66127.1 hypothetical protein HA51_24120 [Pantoea rwandensis]
MDSVGFVWFMIGAVVGVVIWFFINRASVRANRQIELLESIDRQLSLITGQESNDGERENSRKENSSAQRHLEEARKKAGL